MEIEILKKYTSLWYEIYFEEKIRIWEVENKYAVMCEIYLEIKKLKYIIFGEILVMWQNWNICWNQNLKIYYFRTTFGRYDLEKIYNVVVRSQRKKKNWRVWAFFGWFDNDSIFLILAKIVIIAIIRIIIIIKFQ